MPSRIIADRSRIRSVIGLGVFGVRSNALNNATPIAAVSPAENTLLAGTGDGFHPRESQERFAVLNAQHQGKAAEQERIADNCSGMSSAALP